MMSSHRRAPVRHLVDARDEIQVLDDRQVVVEAELLRHVADLAADRRASRMMSRPRQVPLPPSGTSRPHSMRIVVVLPLPLAPRKPQISPAATCKRQARRRPARRRSSCAGRARR